MFRPAPKLGLHQAFIVENIIIDGITYYKMLTGWLRLLHHINLDGSLDGSKFYENSNY